MWHSNKESELPLFLPLKNAMDDYNNGNDDDINNNGRSQPEVIPMDGYSVYVKRSYHLLSSCVSWRWWRQMILMTTCYDTRGKRSLLPGPKHRSDMNIHRIPPTLALVSRETAGRQRSLAKVVNIN